MITQSIGWTLIHSLWQGAIIYFLIKVSFSFIRKSDVRYGIGVVGLALMLLSSLITFSILNRGTATEGFDFLLIQKTVSVSSEASLIQIVLNFIDQNIVWLLRFWILGFVAGTLRIAAGLWYINKLRRSADPVSEEWANLVNDLSSTLNVTRVVTMAEAAISSPMVVGFVKPMILFPMGLLSGLTTEQVETILVHELSHIRRQDYIINLVQSVIETIFFFNPFVLLVSALIREERENCCDDVVIAKGISPISYVKTLAQLEAAKSSSFARRSELGEGETLALGIAGSQNQLLNRIKRIMENSAKNDWGKGRLVPVALLFLGLMCASWITIGSDKKEEVKHVVLANDTVREMIINLNASEPIEHIQLLEIPDAPSAPDPGVPEPFEAFEFPPVPQFDFAFMDTIPELAFDNNFDSFEQDFREKFKSQFKDFYTKNHEQFDKLFEEMKMQELNRRREAGMVIDFDQIARHQDLFDAQMALEMAKQDQMIAENQRQYIELQVPKQDMDILATQYLKSAEMYKDMSLRQEKYFKEVTKMLRDDGYLGPDEVLNDINFNDDGITINGKKVKVKDEVKYRAHSDKFFQNDRLITLPGRSE